MNFKVPQFIERETRIIGPLTFRQFGFVGTGGFLFFILYSFSAHINSTLFILLSLMIAGIFGSFAFLKIEGHPLPVLFNSFISFSSTPRTYLWERKDFTSKISQKTELKKEEEKVDHSLDIKLFKQSRLKDLSSRIEIKD